jgi:hypothetical protein
MESDSTLGSRRSSSYRPMNLIRQPSTNPPAFNAESPPPSAPTPPPPGYETLTPLETRDGWEYFWGNPIARPSMPLRTLSEQSDVRALSIIESLNDVSDDDTLSIDEDLMVRVPTLERSNSWTR